jgi:hypothetical protein
MLTKVAFISIGIMIVLFVFRSWAKGFIFAWIIFVSVVFFFDYSFVLEATRTQANTTTVETDGELSRLTIKADAAASQVLTLQAEHAISTRPETLADVKSQIEVAQANVSQYEIERKARIRIIESGNAAIKIKSNDIFNAVPNAWKDGRYIPLVVFALVFLGLQLIVASSIDLPGKKSNEAVEDINDYPEPVSVAVAPLDPITDTIIREFVRFSWYPIRQGLSDKITTKEVFFDLMKRQNKTYNETTYIYLVDQCKRMDIIDGNYTVKMKDEESVVKLLGGLV